MSVSRSPQSITLHRNFVDVITIKVLRWWTLVDYLSGSSLIVYILRTREPLCGENEIGLWKNQRDSNLRRTQLIIASAEDTGRSSEPRNADALRSYKRAGSRFCSSLRQECCFASTLTLAQWDLFRCLTYKMLRQYIIVFKLLSLW